MQHVYTIERPLPGSDLLQVGTAFTHRNSAKGSIFRGIKISSYGGREKCVYERSTASQF